jgi:hypothetical protein
MKMEPFGRIRFAASHLPVFASEEALWFACREVMRFC